MDNTTTLSNTTRSSKNLEEALNTVLSEYASTIQDVKYIFPLLLIHFHAILYHK